VEKTQFVITAADNSRKNLYIQRARLNGKEWTRSWITHQQIVTGGELRLQMGPEPNRQWGAAPEDRPPSGLLSA